MGEKIEVQRLSGRLDMCEVELLHDRYLVATIGDDTLICNRRHGAWFEMSYPSILGRLNVIDELLSAAKTAERT